MSLITRRLRGRAGKLLVLLASVNAACALNFRPVPNQGMNEVWEYLGVPSRAPSADEELLSQPIVVWRAEAGRGFVGVPAVGDRVTVVASVDRWVYALDTRTGQLFWRFRGDAPFGVGPLIHEGIVYVASEGNEGRITAIRLETGKKVWQTLVGDVASPLAVRDTLIYGATHRGVAFALGVQKGRRVWAREIGGTRSGPLVSGEYIVLVTLTDSVFVLNRRTGTVISRVRLPTSTLAPLALASDSMAVLSSPAGSVIAITIPAGTVQWRVETGEPVLGAPAVARDTVFAVTNGCSLWSIPLSAPSSAERADLACGTVAASTLLRNGLLVATVGADIVLFNRRTHERVWSHTLPNPLKHPPIVRNQRIVLAPTVGKVVSLR
ncbi:MAG: PQQ-binding-like beta-propeller repeat protein [Gemmatimonadaceae bacterium]